MALVFFPRAVDVLFCVHAAGRSLGLDAWLRRNVSVVREKIGLSGRLLNIVT
jgi:hypothetical protein